MLGEFLYSLAKYHIIFNAFRYITFRAACATITAMIIGFVFAPMIIRALKGWKAEELIRDDGPSTHLGKKGTPTMGGIIIILGTVIPTLLWAELNDRYIHLMLLTTLWMGAIGFWDDYLKVIKKKAKGMIARYKLFGQVVLGVIVAVVITKWPLIEGMEIKTSVPFFKSVFLDFRSAWVYAIFIILVLAGTTNAVNLTDGLDGLAAGLSAFAAFAFAGFTYIYGRVDASQYLQILYLPGIGELTIFCMSLLGACLAFLWFNVHPAEVFMGDTGSLAIGGALAMVSILLKSEFLLVVVGGVFVIEIFSVILQVIYFKLTGGKRLFRMAPLHHHYELKGWQESKVVSRFYILGAICVLLAMGTLKIR